MEYGIYNLKLEEFVNKAGSAPDITDIARYDSMEEANGFISRYAPNPANYEARKLKIEIENDPGMMNGNT